MGLFWNIENLNDFFVHGDDWKKEKKNKRKVIKLLKKIMEINWSRIKKHFLFIKLDLINHLT